MFALSMLGKSFFIDQILVANITRNRRIIRRLLRLSPSSDFWKSSVLVKLTNMPPQRKVSKELFLAKFTSNLNLDMLIC